MNRLHLYENPWEPETKTRGGKEYFLTTSEVPGNEPETCGRCCERVGYWYESYAPKRVYCEDCTIVHEQRGE